MKKIILIVALSFTMLFASFDFQNASKEKLMSIKGIGVKKALAIMEYRKTNKITSVEDLKNIKGFGSKLVKKIKKAIDFTGKKDKLQHQFKL